VNLADHSLRVATLAAIADLVAKEYAQARKEAEAEFKANRAKKLDIALPDGEVVGEITVTQPGPTVKVNEDDLIAWVGEHNHTEIEEYLDGSALLDQEVIEYCRANRDDLVKRRVRKVWRDELQKMLTANDGQVMNSAGEPTKVAEVTANKATGSFALNSDRQGIRSARIIAALRAGELAEVVEMPVVLALPAGEG
jgi:hypothetical protein